MPDTPSSGYTPRPTNQGSADGSLALITMYEISKILGSTLNLERSLRDVLNILSSYLQMRRGVVTLREDNGALEVVAVTGMSMRSAREGEAPFPLEAMNEVIGTAMPLIVYDMAGDDRFAPYAAQAYTVEDDIQSLIAVPLKTTGRPFGTLSIERHRDGSSRFQFEHDVRFLTMVGNLIGQTVALERKVAADRERLFLEKARLEKALPRPDPPLKGAVLENVVGGSEAMLRVSAQVRQVAPSRATVLLRGESGTGKELIARAIHYLSPRADKPFIKVNCAALTETLLESELFGHEKGAYTGATSERKGRFEMAHGGTLFLDEIGEISPYFQAKLLRVLQEGEFERVGGNRTLSVDVRLVTATNKDLEDAVIKGDFRADLYYRINVVPIFLPALRERREDVPLLARFFLDKFNEENGRTLRFAENALLVMGQCSFPGNVRELENCVYRAATLAQQDVIQDFGLSCRHDQCLSATLWRRQGSGASKAIGGLASAPVTEVEPPPQEPTLTWEPPPAPTPMPRQAAPDTIDDGPGEASDSEERARLIAAMEKAGWVQAKAARLLGMTPRQIGYALKKHDIPLKRL
ncbi:nif-specific transcriptional activator NifA [Pararhodospirillum oryzae]|uniref:Nif-specific regulatory protein n=1 Tax=Pararhodospirillum oryzae TaxID=478448 RepID=A0A512H3B8_9PROT|nr:nif-specific transcriptional activator NifA [Pararhodospirillum oryzae]GEO79952.1 nif-specific transcriptional activator NifA [Pararhodospirillum oryzae]